METTHQKVDRMAREKLAKESEAELIKLAKQDIGRFVVACESKGFRIGVKVGFWVGIMVGLFFYFMFT